MGRDRSVSENQTLAKLGRGGVVVGTFLRFANPSLAEYLAIEGLDFVVFDGEHGPLNPEKCEDLVRAVELHGATPIVRVESHSESSILRYLDTGALGCHVPGVNSEADALHVVQAVKFHPMGRRGLSSSRAARFGHVQSFGNYVEVANRNSLVVAHLETAEAIGAADQIAAVDGIDVLLVGALDLSQDLGIPGSTSGPEIRSAIGAVAAAAVRHGKVLGAAASTVDSIDEHLALGARYIVVTTESLLRPGLSRLVDKGSRTGARTP